MRASRASTPRQARSCRRRARFHGRICGIIPVGEVEFFETNCLIALSSEVGTGKALRFYTGYRSYRSSSNTTKKWKHPPFCRLLEGSEGCFGVAGSRSFNLLNLINLTLRLPFTILFPDNSDGANLKWFVYL